jgi:hypothetical protein
MTPMEIKVSDDVEGNEKIVNSILQIAQRRNDDAGKSTLK